jgi:hypothetical protein
MKTYTSTNDIRLVAIRNDNIYPEFNRQFMNFNEQQPKMDNQDILKHSSIKNRIIQTVIDVIVIIVIFIIFGIVYLTVDPKIRYMTCDESDIFFPFKEDTIPFWAVGVFATIGPIIFIIFIELFNAKLLPLQKTKNISGRIRRRKFFICLFHSLSLFILGIGITLLLTGNTLLIQYLL